MTSRHLGESERNLDMTTCIGEAYLTNREIVINDTQMMDKKVSSEIVRREGIVSLAHAPIAVEGQPIGVLSAFSRVSKGIFTEEFIDLFHNLAGQIGVAWRNAEQRSKLIEAREHERELQIAKTIQLGLLPSSFPEIAGFELAGLCVPARQVGGDYFDILPSDEMLDLVIADVSGHNIGASLIMAETRTLIQASRDKIRKPATLLRDLNSFIYDDLNRTELFISMFYLSIGLTDKTLRYANAGHNRPLLYRAASQSISELDAEGMIFGVRREVEFIEEQTVLKKGDIILLYTDGITEAENQDGIFFGEQRLKDVLLELKELTAQEIIDGLLAQVRIFSGSHFYNDDISVVIVKYRP